VATTELLSTDLERVLELVLGAQAIEDELELRANQLAIQRFAGRRGWVTFRRVRTNNKGRFGFIYKPTNRGNHSLRVLLPASATHQAATSSPIRVRFVRRP
jgi:hypothetical protein